MNYIKNHVYSLKLIAHNGSRFDLPALQKILFKIVDPAKISAIRKGCSFISLTIENLCFLDSMHYVPSMSLAKFAKTFEVEESKGIFPYEFFRSVKDIENCKEFPSIQAFFTSLTKRIDAELVKAELDGLRSNFKSEEEIWAFFGYDFSELERVFVSPKSYFMAKTEYLEKVSAGEWFSMLCVLKNYNLSDCRILYESMSNFIRMVKNAFNADVLQHMTLPGLAEG